MSANIPNEKRIYKTFFTDKHRVKRYFYDRYSKSIYHSIAKIPSPLKLNFDVVPLFLEIGYIPGNKTLFDGVECLPGGAKIELVNNGWKIINKYYYEESINKEKFTNISEKELTIEGKKIWLEIINELYRPNRQIVVPISGGLDSRLILAGLFEFTEPSKIFTYTFGTVGSLDYEIGNKIARYFGTNHFRFDCARTSISHSHLKKVCALTDGNVNLFLPIFQMIINEQYGYEAQYWMGYMGGPLGGGHLKKYYSTTHKDAIEKYFFNEKKSNTPIRGFRKFLPNWSNYIEKIAESNDKITYDEQMDLYNRQQRNMSNQLLLSGYNYCTPFVADKWIEFILSLPRKHRMYKHAYKLLLTKSFTKFSKFPIKNNLGLPIDAKRTDIILKKIKYCCANIIFSNSYNPMLNYLDYKMELKNNSLIKKIIERNIYHINKLTIKKPHLNHFLKNWCKAIDHQNHNYLMHLSSLSTIIETFNVLL